MNVNYEAPKTHQDIDRELKDIEKEIRMLQSPGVDVTAELFTSGDGDIIESEATSIKEA